jgi:DNA phosphorothioation-dependent restriction protein DptH
MDEQVFIRDDGDTKAKRRRKNVLIYNPDHKDSVTIDVRTNITIRQSGLEINGCKALSSSKLVRIEVNPEGCTFAQAKITDSNNNITYVIKVCIVDVVPKYLESIQTAYMLNIPKILKRSTIQIFGVTKHLEINPGSEDVVDSAMVPDGVYECRYNQTLNLLFDEETIDTDTGHIDCKLKFGSIIVPIQIQDEVVKPTELTGAGAFKRKFSEKKSLEYRNGKIIAGTTDFFYQGSF